MSAGNNSKNYQPQNNQFNNQLYSNSQDHYYQQYGQEAHDFYKKKPQQEWEQGYYYDER